MGLPFEEIAERISRVGRGQAQAIVAIPDGVTFPLDYKITRQACHKAFKKAIAREPALELAELRKLDTMRCEEMFMNLQPSVRKGDARAVEVNEAAMYFDLFRAGVQVLVDLGVPLPELGRPSVETTATPAQQLEKKEGTGH
jgi:hypothetical protein